MTYTPPAFAPTTYASSHPVPIPHGQSHHSRKPYDLSPLQDDGTEEGLLPPNSLPPTPEFNVRTPPEVQPGGVSRPSHVFRGRKVSCCVTCLNSKVCTAITGIFLLASTALTLYGLYETRQRSKDSEKDFDIKTGVSVWVPLGLVGVILFGCCLIRSRPRPYYP